MGRHRELLPGDCDAQLIGRTGVRTPSVDHLGNDRGPAALNAQNDDRTRQAYSVKSDERALPESDAFLATPGQFAEGNLSRKPSKYSENSPGSLNCPHACR